jgi:hypothetical protein
VKLVKANFFTERLETLWFLPFRSLPVSKVMSVAVHRTYV